MRLRVETFARARELASQDSLYLEVPERITVAQLRECLVAACPALGALLPRCAIAVNDEFASDEVRVEPGARVAVLPPVSGGDRP